jgi:succinyl-diaminopimelate desuccinylase
MVKNGRRGSMSGKLVVKGVQGHIRLPASGEEPRAFGARARAGRTAVAGGWDAGNEYFPPTSWQIIELS